MKIVKLVSFFLIININLIKDVWGYNEDSLKLDASSSMSKKANKNNALNNKKSNAVNLKEKLKNINLNEEINPMNGDHVTNRVAGLSCKYVWNEHKEAVSTLCTFNVEGQSWLVSL